MSVPKYDEMFIATIKALQELGDSGTNGEIEGKVANILELSDRDISEMHRGNKTKFSYRLAWTRNYLKRYGLIKNSSRGVWLLTDVGVDINKLSPADINKKVKLLDRLVGRQSINSEINNESDWRQQLLVKLYGLSPTGFEIVCQRFLREAGFVEVEVTGRSGDGGIDGRGIVRVNLISFRVIFQSKRYRGAVNPAEIREFKGTMVGRAERGLYITTGYFTKNAKAEANRDGSAPIDLIDGDRLLDYMKEFEMGVNVKTEEKITIDDEWMSQFK